MSTLAFPRPPEPALARSAALAFLVHVLLASVMVLGVRWQSRPPETVSVELVELQPPRPEPRVEEVKPTPPPPAPKAEPVPPPQKAPDIAVKAKPEPKPKPKPKAEAKPKAEPKPKPEAKPKPIPDFEKNLREQMAREQKALDAEKRERELAALLARQQTDALNKARAEYITRIQQKVKSNWQLPLDIKDNPEAVFLVVQLPTGEVLSARIVKPSGNPAYDAAVERAILRSSPLPLPATRELFARELRLTFRPQDK